MNREQLIKAAREFMPRDQFEIHINMTPAELRIVTAALMADFAAKQLERAESVIKQIRHCYSIDCDNCHILVREYFNEKSSK